MTLLHEFHEDWLKAKDSAARQCRDEGHTDYARALCDCSMFHGTESWGAVAELIHSPRGTEFMLTFGWPSREFIDKRKGELVRELQPYGIYIDAGNVTIHDRRKVFLYGDTRAVIDCTLTRLYRIAAMGGASAMVTADGYSMVRVESDEQSHIHTITKLHAKVFK